MTVLIIGGAYQGKRKGAENLYAVRTKTGVKRLVVCAVLWHRKQTQSCA